jgi:hypothetical protein
MKEMCTKTAQKEKKKPKEYPPAVEGKAIPREYYDFGADSDDEGTSYEINPNAKVPQEIHQLGEFLETKGVEIVNMYLKRGKKREAEELKEKLKKAMVALKF